MVSSDIPTANNVSHHSRVYSTLSYIIMHLSIVCEIISCCSRKHQNSSRAPNSPDLNRIWGRLQERCVQYTHSWHQRLEAASQWCCHAGARTLQNINELTDTWTNTAKCMQKAKGYYFERAITNRLFTATHSLSKKMHYALVYSNLYMLNVTRFPYVHTYVRNAGRGANDVIMRMTSQS